MVKRTRVKDSTALEGSDDDDLILADEYSGEEDPESCRFAYINPRQRAACFDGRFLMATMREVKQQNTAILPSGSRQRPLDRQRMGLMLLLATFVSALVKFDLYTDPKGKAFSV